MDRTYFELSLRDGELVGYHEKIWVIKSPISLEQVLLEDPLSGEKIIALIADLTLPITSKDEIAEAQNKPDISTIPEATWQLALQRREIIEPY